MNDILASTPEVNVLSYEVDSLQTNNSHEDVWQDKDKAPGIPNLRIT